MSSATFLRFCETFHFCSFLLLFFTRVLCLPELKLNEEAIKINLRPLKYSEKCTKLCDNIICQPVKECDNGVISKEASYCGCCEACIKFLDINESCIETTNGVLALITQSKCKIGSVCKDGKCQLKNRDEDPEEDSCLLHRDIRKEHILTGNYLTNLWIPQCDDEGNYEAKQKKTTKSICVDKTGSKIFGSADDSLKNTCACSRLMAEKEKQNPLFFNLKPQAHCSSAGSFDTLQCIANLCYCGDANTGEMKSELVRLDFLHMLPCYDGNRHRETYLTDCETQAQRSKKLSHDFLKKGVKIIKNEEVQCDPDGTFSPKQCLPHRCVCTQTEGIGIGTYYAEIGQLTEGMTCSCARDESLSCDLTGNFLPFTCFDGTSKCVCVDGDGESIEESSMKDIELDKSSMKTFCENVINSLTNYPEEDYEYDR